MTIEQLINQKVQQLPLENSLKVNNLEFIRREKIYNKWYEEAMSVKKQ